MHTVAPICRPGQVQNYGVARKETAKIICELEANPHDVNFTWRFNSSANFEMMEIPLTSVVVDRAKSIAHYTPYSEEVISLKIVKFTLYLLELENIRKITLSRIP